MRHTTLLLCGALALLVLSAGGCQKDQLTVEDIRSDPTPELESMAFTAEQRKNIHARAADTSLRQIWDDLDTLLLIDRGSRMTFYPVP